MKIRKGFVSNSSSSSYICDVCSEDYNGMDASLSDFDLYSCINGHTYCDSHALKDMDDLTIDEKRVLMIKIAYDKEKIKIMTNEEIEKNFDDSYQYDIRCEMPSECCPCCQFIKPTALQILKYMLWKNKWTEKQAIKRMKGDFKNYDEMLEKTKEK